MQGLFALLDGGDAADVVLVEAVVRVVVIHRRDLGYQHEPARHVRLAPEGVMHALGQARSKHRYDWVVVDDEARVRARIVELASDYGRYGYGRMEGILRN